MILKRRRSRSSERVASASGYKNRSRSVSNAASANKPDDSSLIGVEENFYVPYRCLIPPDAAGALIGRGAVLLRSLASETNVKCSILRSEDNPPGLKDRIIVLNGTQKEKDLGIKWVLGQMRGAGRGESSKTTFVFMLPSEAASPVIGTRGSVVYDISNKTGTEIDVMKERIAGTNDRAVTIRGTAEGIVQAISRIHSIVQGMHDQGKLLKKDFAYCDVFPSKNVSESKISLQVSKDADSPDPIVLMITRTEGDWLVAEAQLPTVVEIEESTDCLISLEDKVDGVSVNGSKFGEKQVALQRLLDLLSCLRNQNVTEILVHDAFGASEFKQGVFQLISNRSNCDVKYDSNRHVVVLTGDIKNRINALEMVTARIHLFSNDRSHSPQRTNISVIITDEQAKKIKISALPADVCVSIQNNPTRLVISAVHRSSIAKTVYQLLPLIETPKPAVTDSAESLI